ncbi:18720_t:CDS:2, partial [Gigaspora rosea]
TTDLRPKNTIQDLGAFKYYFKFQVRVHLYLLVRVVLDTFAEHSIFLFLSTVPVTNIASNNDFARGAILANSFLDL